MKILVTGHLGYIGTMLVPMLLKAGHDVVGLDADLYDDVHVRDRASPSIARRIAQGHPRRHGRRDLAASTRSMHLAAISNDPLGDLNADVTDEINHHAAVAARARRQGSRRDAFHLLVVVQHLRRRPATSSSTSRRRSTRTRRTAKSKVLAEQDLSRLADEISGPTFLRNATAYGVSPRLRGDLVVNNLTGYAVTTGEVLHEERRHAVATARPHRGHQPRVHRRARGAARDSCTTRRSTSARPSENYRVSEIAAIVEESFREAGSVRRRRGSRTRRCYRVDCDKLPTAVPAFETALVRPPRRRRAVRRVRRLGSDSGRIRVVSLSPDQARAAASGRGGSRRGPSTP